MYSGNGCDYMRSVYFNVLIVPTVDID